MSQSVNVVENVGCGTIFFNGSTVLTGDLISDAVVNVPVAWPGTLTTRTDNDTGTITMTDAGHLITTGAKVDLYFSSGLVRRNVTVGTVSGTSVPIDLGAGDNLPIATTAIIVSKVVAQALAITVAEVVFFGMKCDYECQFTFIDTDGSAIDYTKHLTPATSGAEVDFIWHSAYGANPMSGTLIATVKFSHADTAAAHDMSLGVLSS